MTDVELCYMGAVELLDSFRRRTVSPVELMQALLRRADQVEPLVNAWAYRFDDEALHAASLAEARYVKGAVEPRTIEGLPVAVKMDVDIAGQPANFGSQSLEARVASETELLPQRIIDAGGIIHARTTMPEFGAASFTHTQVWGTTRNPWKLDAGPGGSSGGSAAALAAGTAPLATGADSAGSIRMPASFCGVVGYKPPRGRVPLSTDASFDSLMSAGPLARTVADCALFADVLSGPDLSDPWSLPGADPVAGPWNSVEGCRIAFTADMGGFPIEPEIRQRTIDAALALDRDGAKVEEVELSWDWQEVLWAGKVSLEFNYAGYADLPRDELMPYTNAFLDGVRDRQPADYSTARRIRHAAWQVMRRIFEHFDVLICPTQGLLSFAAGDDYVAHGPVIDGSEVKYPFETHMGLPFNLLNSLPVLTVPVGRCSNGVPTGIQIVGRPYADRSVFTVGAAVERNRGGELAYRTPEHRPDLR